MGREAGQHWSATLISFSITRNCGDRRGTSQGQSRGGFPKPLEQTLFLPKSDSPSIAEVCTPWHTHQKDLFLIQVFKTSVLFPFS